MKIGFLLMLLLPTTQLSARKPAIITIDGKVGGRVFEGICGVTRARRLAMPVNYEILTPK
jgi:hypothetical protein